VKKLVGLGVEVCIETGAGGGARISDADFEAAGATIAADEAACLKDADLVFKVQRPISAGEDGPDELAMMKSGAALAAILQPFSNREQADAFAKANITAFAMDWMPRITRAQSMDVLSSQANLAGYKSVLDACEYFSRAMPMMMTAAGTIAPARVFVLGVGVAGLQAIATAKRLGAIVSATDVRPATKEQVESLGAEFVMVESEETREAETTGGYAKEMSEDFKRRQAELVSAHIKKQDVVITTALIPGRPAPTLIDDTQVGSMKAGSVIVDLSVEAGGNCTQSKLGEVVEVGGVTIIGHHNWPSRLAVDASALYAKNLLNFIQPHIDGESHDLKIDWEDETITGTALTRDGAVVHPSLTGEGN
jgi:NAD(P) transhydrogenase subunit alpha